MGFKGFADTIKSQTSNLCCVMHSSLMIAFISLIFFRLDFLTLDVVNLCLITS